jgi:hypothetical protein
MSGAITALQELFGQGDPATLVTKFEGYKAALASSHADTLAGRVRLDGDTKRIYKTVAPDTAHMLIESLTKSLTPDQASQLGQDIALLRSNLMPDLQKDWTGTSPMDTRPYDLQAPAKWLAPLRTPLRNTIPRTKGEGGAAEYRRILTTTNSVPGTKTMPFFDSATQTSTYGGPGNLTLNRPAKITTTGDVQIRAYMEMGFSDSVTWRGFLTSLGFDNLLSLSQTALLFAHLMGEEWADLAGRGTSAGGAGYQGAVPAPAGVTTATATTGGTIAAATYSIYVVALNGQGQSAPSTVATQVTTGSTSTITVTVGTEPEGGLYYGLYVGTTAGITNATLQRTFVGNTVTITSYSVTATVGTATDSSFSALAYDGFYAVQSDLAQTGYFSRINGAFSTTSPGSEFDTALTTLWTLNGATPEEIWLTGAGRTAYGQLMRIGGASGAASGYRTSVVTGDGSVIAGAAVTGHVNPASGTVVDIKAHPDAISGTALIRSRSLNIAGANVPSPVEKRCVQDYVGIQWPDVQMTKDASTYGICTLVHYAPQFSGLLAGITNG